MEFELDRNCFIAPTRREARKLAEMLKRQGDMRGIYIDEEDATLVIFDSYGNTHDSAQRQLKVRIAMSVIYRLDGQIYIDCTFAGCEKKQNHPLESVFSDEDCDLYRAIYKHLGINEVVVTNWE